MPVDSSKNLNLYQRSFKQERFAGIHLAGANAQKTSLVILEGVAGKDPLIIEKVYEKIGTLGSLFSDDRLAEILGHEAELQQVFVDCPISVPPCVACQRPVCPGSAGCDDVGVAWMMSMSRKIPTKRGARKHRSVNPQSQRLCDVYAQAEGQLNQEPSYSANLAPLVIRAQTLQKRLRGLGVGLTLKETSVANSLLTAAPNLHLSEDCARFYRRFENGKTYRYKIIHALQDCGWIEASDDEVELLSTVENFSALITAWVGALHSIGRTNDRPQPFLEHEGWVITPSLASPIDLPKPTF